MFFSIQKFCKIITFSPKPQNNKIKNHIYLSNPQNYFHR